MKYAIHCLLFVGFALGGCSSNDTNADASIDGDSNDASVCESGCGSDASTTLDAKSEASLDSKTSPAEGGASDSPDVVDTFTTSIWICPYGTPLGGASELPWSQTLNGSERVSANGSTVIWRASTGAKLSVADLDSEAGTFVAGKDLSGTASCGDFDISPDGLTVICVTADGSGLQTAKRAALGSDFAAPSTTDFNDVNTAIPSLPGFTGSIAVVSHPVFASGSFAVMFEVQGVGIAGVSKLFDSEPWSSPFVAMATDSRTLDGAFDPSVLFLWDPSKSVTDVAWLNIDNTWIYTTLGPAKHAVPNTDCTGVYSSLNGSLVLSGW